ncbi:MAG: glycyl-radical enzyme activating protein [Chloroflexi bacterium]|nr:glycyl-radical enzyme activating protein [Chloroflexota bacterium]
MKGLIFNIQRYSIHDGPGIRTVVFLKGCPLSCLWCCNPESQSFAPELEFRASLCQHSGRCIAACPEDAIHPDPWVAAAEKIDRQRCTDCGACVEVCPSQALHLVGEWMAVEEALAEVLRDASYYRRSGGGVTLSGGEPLAQPDFSLAFLKACYEHNIHTAMETTGAVAWELYEKVLPFVDVFLYDIKHMDSEAHRRLTGVPNERILENARRLSRSRAQIILRLPLIPGLNTGTENLEATARLAAQLQVMEVHLMPFHQLGKDKYRHLGRTYTLEGLTDLRKNDDGRAQIQQAVEIMAAYGLETFVGG